MVARSCSPGGLVSGAIPYPTATCKQTVTSQRWRRGAKRTFAAQVERAYPIASSFVLRARALLSTSRGTFYQRRDHLCRCAVALAYFVQLRASESCGKRRSGCGLRFRRRKDIWAECCDALDVQGYQRRVALSSLTRSMVRNRRASTRRLVISARARRRRFPRRCQSGGVRRTLISRSASPLPNALRRRKSSELTLLPHPLCSEPEAY